MPRIVATVQMRMGSGRLPGKTMRDLNGKPLIAHLLDRVRQAKRIDDVVIAAPDSAFNDIIADFCTDAGVACFRGSEVDVLGRMLGALESQNADVGIELYGDSPLIDPVLIDECIDAYLADSSFDWVGNDRSATFTGGMNVEVFKVSALRDSAERTQDPAVREHGTLFIRKHPDLYKVKDIEASGGRRRPEIILEVDTEDDLLIIESIIKHFAPRVDFSLEEILAYLDSHPDVSASNQHVFRRWRQYRIAPKS